MLSSSGARNLIAVLLVPLTIGYVVGSWSFVGYAVKHPKPLYPFLTGATGYFLVWLLFLRQRRGIWETFEHELTHALFCLLCFSRVTSFSAHSMGGQISHMGAGGIRTTLISLAPYFFPTYTAVLLAIRPLVMGGFVRYIDVGIGITFAYHLISTCREFSYRQPDIRQCGLFFSTVFLILCNLLVITLVPVIIALGYKAAWVYLKGGPLWIYQVAMAIGKVRWSRLVP